MRFCNFQLGSRVDLDLGPSWAPFGCLGPAKSRSQQCFGGPEGLQERPKRRPRAPHTPLEASPSPTKLLQRLQEASKLTFFGSRGLQERSKRLPRGFLRASASKMRFGSHLGPTLGSKKRAWGLKSHGILRDILRFLRFCNFQLGSRLDLDLGPSRAPFGCAFGPQAV